MPAGISPPAGPTFTAASAAPGTGGHVERRVSYAHRRLCLVQREAGGSPRLPFLSRSRRSYLFIGCRLGGNDLPVM